MSGGGFELAEQTSFSSKLSESIWGHRFMDGQRGPEYVLEFLNVIAGTSFKLNADEYSRNKMIGFRKFIFEGSKEGRANEIVRLNEEERRKIIDQIEDTDKIDVIKEFFRNLEVPIHDGRGKPADRSWYAKSLYPLHESLLFFEVRKRGKTISFERNFYARGGELYYIMLSIGTENNLALRLSIEKRLNELLSKNKPIETIVSSISEAFGESIYAEEDENSETKFAPLKIREGETDPYLAPNDSSETQKKKPCPYLPADINKGQLEEFAYEFNKLINLNIEMFEMFNLMNSLVTFQLMRYLLERVNERDKAHLFLDAMDGQVKQIMKLSSESFSKNELMIKKKYEESFRLFFDEKIENEKNVMEELDNWKANEGKKFFELLNLGNLHKNTKTRALKVLNKCQSYDDIRNKLYNVVKDIIDDQLKKHQIPIIRGLVRDGGIGGYRTGSNYRYYISDNFLKVLVFSNVDSNKGIEFSDFMNKLFEKYGIIIGEVEAKRSGLYEESKLNVRYFQMNEHALRDKLLKNGLLLQYSDATAMIKNPYGDAAEGVSV